MRDGLNQRMVPVMAHDEGVTIIPFSFQINGTSNPDNLGGDLIESVARSEQGEFLCTLKSRPAVCFVGFADVSTTADDTDIYGKVDWSEVVSAGTFVVRLMTSTTETDPTDDLFVGGFLLVSKTTRSGHR